MPDDSKISNASRTQTHESALLRAMVIPQGLSCTHLECRFQVQEAWSLLSSAPCSGARAAIWHEARVYEYTWGFSFYPPANITVIKVTTRAPIATGTPTVRAMAVVDRPFSTFPNSRSVAWCFSVGRPSGYSTSTSWCSSTISLQQQYLSNGYPRRAIYSISYIFRAWRCSMKCGGKTESEKKLRPKINH